MDILLLTLGSHGDVHPFVGLALELRRRGHRPLVATNGHFEKLCRGVGLEFASIGTEQQYRNLVDNKDLWSPSKAFKVVFGAVGESLRAAYEVVARFVQERNAPLVVASSLGLAARVARDKFEFPMVTVHIQPAVIRSLVDPPKIPGLIMPRWLPMWLKRGIMDGGDKYVLDPIVGPPVNSLRKELGLPPVKRILKDWWQSPDRVIGLFPEWFGPPASDWPPQIRLADFPLWDEPGAPGINAELEDFLSSGEKPIAFTPGSAMVHGHEFFASAVEACERIGRRGLLLTRFAEQLPARLPDCVKHITYAPFAELLPRCLAVVHHGGIGSCGQGLRAGIPQLLQPMAHDQFDNARRLERLGVGLWLPVRQFTGKNVARALSTLLDDATYRQRAQDIARRFLGRSGLEIAADLIEELAPRPSPPPVMATVVG
ncbi:MAG: glycosyltransferase [Phycisphaerae bacterium]|nr:glycosyltransferase [Phycisphaerae bacterium]MDW8261385.1 glycosyltransferase [Phycisphaerales bacterium]